MLTVADFDVFEKKEQKKSATRKTLPENRGTLYDLGKKTYEKKLLDILYEQYPQLGRLDH